MSQNQRTSASRPKAVVLGVQLPGVSDEEHDSSLAELARLGKTLGVDVVERVTQRRAKLDGGSVVGEGKLRELAALTGGSGEIPTGPPRRRGKPKAEAAGGEPEETAAEAPPDEAKAGAAPAAARASVVLVDHDLSPSQARNLERATAAEVLDRTAVILAIFQRHARSREARLQVEIARLTYMAPRLRESSGGKDRQGGGIGGEGPASRSSSSTGARCATASPSCARELAAIERDAGARRQRRERRRRRWRSSATPTPASPR